MPRSTISSTCVALLFLLTGCAALPKINQKTFATESLPDTIRAQVEGQVKAGLSWTDPLGENYTVFSKISAKDNSVHLQVKHFTFSNGQARLIRSVEEHRPCPDFDNVTDFVPSSIEITDLDHDGYGEVSFVYFTDCVSDVSPYSAKLVILENGKVFTMSGFAKYIFDGRISPSEYTLSPELKGASSAFIKFAIKLWERTVVIDVDGTFPR